jgi:hypothetical protein
VCREIEKDDIGSWAAGLFNQRCDLRDRRDFGSILPIAKFEFGAWRGNAYITCIRVKYCRAVTVHGASLQLHAQFIQLGHCVEISR